MKTVVIFVSALQFLILYGLISHGPAPFGSDEEQSLNAAEKIRLGDSWGSVAEPLLPLILATVTSKGETGVVPGRLLVAGGVVVLTLGQMLLAGRLWGPGAAALWGVVNGLNPALLVAGAQIIPAAWFAGMMGLALLTLTRAYQREGAWWPAGLWLVVSLWTHPAGILLLAFVSLLLLARFAVRGLSTVMAVTCLGYLPLLLERHWRAEEIAPSTFADGGESTLVLLLAPFLAWTLIQLWLRARRVAGVLPSSRLILCWVLLVVILTSPQPTTWQLTWLMNPSLSWRSGAAYANYLRLRELLEADGLEETDRIFYGPGPHLPGSWLWPVKLGNTAAVSASSLDKQLAHSRYWIFDDATRSAYGEAFNRWSHQPQTGMYPGLRYLGGWQSVADQLDVWSHSLMADSP